MPLLALGSDQVAKLRAASQAYGAIKYYHLDEHRDRPQTIASILSRVDNLAPDTTSTTFLFVSPQLIMNNPNVRNCLIKAHSKSILKSVFLDEVHLYVDHGVSFRDDIAALKESFFSIVFPPNKPSVHPCFCSMTGTFTRDQVSSLADLVGFTIPQSGIQWGSMEDFARREIEIVFSISDDFTTTALNPFLQNIRKGVDGSIKGIVYCNSVKDAEKKLNRINTMLDAAVDFVGDAILIHGQQQKTEKFVNTKVFLGQVDHSSLTPVILVATSAANCGIDDHRIRYIVRNGLPFGFLSFLQELGRAARYKGAICDDNSYHIVLNLKNFVQSLQLYHYFNSPKFVTKAGKKMTPAEITVHKKTDHYKQSMKKFKKLLPKQIGTAFELLRLLTLRRGCWHVILEAFCATGGDLSDIDYSKHAPCLNACPHCTGKLDQFFLPIHKEDAIIWLAEVVSKSGTILCDDMLVNLLWEKPKYRYNIFGKKDVKRYQVIAFILQLLATNILGCTTKLNEDNQYETQCHLSYYKVQNKQMPLFNNDLVWKGITVHSTPRTREYTTNNKSQN
jgi:hypothetical protein